MQALRYPCLLLLLSGIACTTDKTQSTASTEPPVNASVTAKPVNYKPEKRGLVKQVEDVGYPFAVLTIQLPGQSAAQTYSLNMERVPGASLEAVSGWAGRNVTFTYSSDPTNALLDIHKDNQSLLGNDAPALSADTKQITGKLSGADEETAGDQPATIRITADDNRSQTFPYFVTKELVAANGSRVTGFFEERVENNITAIRLLPK